MIFDAAMKNGRHTQPRHLLLADRLQLLPGDVQSLLLLPIVDRAQFAGMSQGQCSVQQLTAIVVGSLMCAIGFFYCSDENLFFLYVDLWYKHIFVLVLNLIIYTAKLILVELKKIIMV